MKILKKWNYFEKSWLIIFTVINIIVFFYSKDSVLGLIASLTGMLSVILVAKGKISNYYFGIINVVLYGFISYQSKYYGEAMLNLGYFLPMQLIGLVVWSKNQVKVDEKTEIKAERMKRKETFFWSLIAIVGILIYGTILKKIGNVLPFADAFTNVLSIIAMILMVKRYIEQWAVWILIDIVSIYMWFFIKSNYNITIMWAAYLINAIYGLINWIILYKKEKE